MTANALHPGAVRTGFGHADGGLLMGTVVRLLGPWMRSPERAAVTVGYLASAPEVAGVTGGYFADCRPATPSPVTRDPDLARRLWQVSAALVGLDGAVTHPGPEGAAGRVNSP